MKNKPLTYILLAVAVVVYYNLFFKVRNYLESDTDASIVEPNRPSIDNVKLVRDTVKLALNYRDPFGETKVSVLPVDVENVPTNVPRPRKEPKYVQWSSIQYFGLMKKTTSNKPLGVVSIDGYKHQVRLGESLYDGIKIVGMNKESIKIRYKGETKEFIR